MAQVVVHMVLLVLVLEVLRPGTSTSSQYYACDTNFSQPMPSSKTGNQMLDLLIYVRLQGLVLLSVARSCESWI